MNETKKIVLSPFVAVINLPRPGVVDSDNPYNGSSHIDKTASLFWVTEEMDQYMDWVLVAELLLGELAQEC